MPIKKHAIESYKHYTLYIVAGMSPAFFIAEKDDPSKGTTLTADSLNKLKKIVDDTLDYAANMKINIWQGPEHNGLLPNGMVKITSHGVNYNGFAIVVKCDYDMDLVVEMACKQPLRVSKKYRKSRNPLNMIKIVCRNCTVSQKG